MTVDAIPVVTVVAGPFNPGVKLGTTPGVLVNAGGGAATVDTTELTIVWVMTEPLSVDRTVVAAACVMFAVTVRVVDCTCTADGELYTPPEPVPDNVVLGLPKFTVAYIGPVETEATLETNATADERVAAFPEE